ncbi:hypothetical protein D3C75_1362050 [compost metagenome]
MRDHLPLPLLLQQADDVNGHPGQQEEDKEAACLAEAPERPPVMLVRDESRQQNT